MKNSSRLYYCRLCNSQAIICTRCDRGNEYCSKECSQAARRKSCNEANQRYQDTSKGKIQNALRQKRFRSCKYKKVTDQGSAKLSLNDLLAMAKNKAKAIFIGPETKPYRCCICGNPVPDWFRKDFLRTKAKKSAQNLSHSPPN